MNDYEKRLQSAEIAIAAGIVLAIILGLVVLLGGPTEPSDPPKIDRTINGS